VRRWRTPSRPTIPTSLAPDHDPQYRPGAGTPTLPQVFFAWGTNVTTTSIVALDAFLEAFRDAGYRGLPGALSELVDNSLEARASRVDIEFAMSSAAVDRVVVIDNGSGIAASDLTRALQFGGSTRFDSRAGFGRYGLGLPGSSISQARQLDVYTWTRKGRPWWSYLSLDHIGVGRTRQIPRPRRAWPPIPIPDWSADHGTVVIWSTCDRIAPLDGSGLALLARAIGRSFRQAIWSGVEMRIDGNLVMPVDPLFLRPGIAPAEAAPYGPPLVFDVDLPGRGRRRRAQVAALFSELPIEAWTDLPNAEKRRMGVAKGGGVSVLRANREIDSGWFFMGEKRKESYDDWWRCEVSFSPELDEFFGVAHTKQGIRPRPELVAILTPHLERIAHVLNGRVRRRFQQIRSRVRSAGKAAKKAEQRDYLLEPLRNAQGSTRRGLPAPRLRYQVTHEALRDRHFFRQEQRRDLLRVTINSAHPFHVALRREGKGTNTADLIELLLLAAARAEQRLNTARDRAAIARHREHWSNALAAFFA
jgi:Histidine kinase-, DNA gyrase B-, and HSP90-like ATPase